MCCTRVRAGRLLSPKLRDLGGTQQLQASVWVEQKDSGVKTNYAYRTHTCDRFLFCAGTPAQQLAQPQ
jgi:hypothetical protein